MYTFPDLLPTTSRIARAPPLLRGLGKLLKQVAGPASGDFLEEKHHSFMPPAHRHQLTRVLLLVAGNWLGLLMMGAALGPLQLSLHMAGSRQMLLAINVAYGMLLAIGAAYIVIPVMRAVALLIANNAIDERNDARRALAHGLLHPTR